MFGDTLDLTGNGSPTVGIVAAQCSRQDSPIRHPSNCAVLTLPVRLGIAEVRAISFILNGLTLSFNKFDGFVIT